MKTATRTSQLLTRVDDLTGAIDAYDAFDERQDGWHKVALDPANVGRLPTSAHRTATQRAHGSA